jgi:hypothetical protein
MYGATRNFITRTQAEAIVEYLRRFADSQRDRGYGFTVELGREIGVPRGVEQAALNRALGLFSDVTDLGPDEAALLAELDRLAAPSTPIPARASREAIVRLAGRVGLPVDDEESALDQLWWVARQARASE